MVVPFAPGGTPAAYFASLGWAAEGIQAPGANSVWTASGTKLTPTTPVTLSWANATGQTFRIEYSIDADYLITAKQTVANSGAAPVSLNSFALIDRLGKPTDPHEIDSWTIHVGPTGYLDGKSVFDVDYDDVEEAANRTFRYNSAGWLGFTDKYWLAAIVPAKGERVTAAISSPAANNYQTLFARDFTSVAPGQQLTATSRIFAGAKEVGILSQYQDKDGITRLSNAIDWGWFEFFEVPIFKLLDWLFQQLGNFGLAIMALTLIIRLLLFPIAQRQFGSMAQMRLVQPKMKALQDRYKDDKPKMQQELMKLYKDEKINPLAGCLPIVIQIPIFYALYKVLMLTIEMRHQPFFLWIKDLSAPDPLHILNLFGLLPFTPAARCDPGRDDVAAVPPEPRARRPGAGAGVQNHAVAVHVHHGAVCRGPAALLDHQQHPVDRAAAVDVSQISGAEGGACEVTILPYLCHSRESGNPVSDSEDFSGSTLDPRFRGDDENG